MDHECFAVIYRTESVFDKERQNVAHRLRRETMLLVKRLTERITIRSL